MGSEVKHFFYLCAVWSELHFHVIMSLHIQEPGLGVSVSPPRFHPRGASQTWSSRGRGRMWGKIYRSWSPDQKGQFWPGGQAPKVTHAACVSLPVCPQRWSVIWDKSIQYWCLGTCRSMFLGVCWASWICWLGPCCADILLIFSSAFYLYLWLCSFLRLQ